MEVRDIDINKKKTRKFVRHVYGLLKENEEWEVRHNLLKHRVQDIRVDTY